ncbi:MAG: peptide chain release factor N(5)-glutamine methyltransferase [Eubacteriaceae bacterium]|nr:peptide chain release factor N(5)-glutamine methyltransferase [Eubacteriaceae bacterium]
MKIREILREATAELENISDSPSLDARVLMCEALGVENIYIITHQADELSSEAEGRFRKMLSMRKESMPVAYIIGRKEFMSMDFYVDERVLIPRSDTETLVERAISIIGGKKMRVLDMCCGSGCIGLSVKKYAGSISLTLADISDGACEVTEINKEKYFPGNSDVEVVKSDLFENITGMYDMILSNPPYISYEEMKTLSKDILSYEPHLALEADNEGLYYYERIADECRGYLRTGGYIIFEIGWSQGEDVKKILEKNNFTETEILKDLAGLDRVVLGKKK